MGMKSTPHNQLLDAGGQKLSPVDEGLNLLDDDAVLVPAEELQQPLNQLLEGDAAVTSHLTDGR